LQASSDNDEPKLWAEKKKKQELYGQFKSGIGNRILHGNWTTYIFTTQELLNIQQIQVEMNGRTDQNKETEKLRVV